MLNIQEQKGFTLVELAIVLTIVGLLIGGILKGQQLIQNARVTATVAQVNGFEAATTNFRDAYGELPGDLMDAQSRIQGCTAACTLSSLGIVDTTGDGKIATVDWDFVTTQNTPLSAGTPPGTAAAATQGEAVLFWLELQNAGLISAVSQEGIEGGTTPTFGGTIPEAKIGGGFSVGNSSGTLGAILPSAIGRTPVVVSTNEYDYTLLGSVIVMIPKPSSFALPSDSIITGSQVLKPSTAANIDRKIDDGLPDQGQVQAYGDAVSCYGKATGTGPFFYKENVDSKDCGLIIRLQR